MRKDKILVVDDEKRIRDTFMVAFDKYDVTAVSSGQKALDILKRLHDIDLIVVDVMMPGITGIDLLRQIKEVDPKQKVVICTGCGSKNTIIEALREHADEYIEKPFDIEDVEQIFERLLNEKRSFDIDRPDYQKNKFEQAQRFISRNYNKAVHLPDVAKEIFLSPKYISRKFKEKTGTGFMEYKKGLRIEMAKQLLQKTSLTVSQIAYKVGYQNPESFMKTFKKAVGMVPSNYRNRNQYK